MNWKNGCAALALAATVWAQGQLPQARAEDGAVIALYKKEPTGLVGTTAKHQEVKLTAFHGEIPAHLSFEPVRVEFVIPQSALEELGVSEVWQLRPILMKLRNGMLYRQIGRKGDGLAQSVFTYDEMLLACKSRASTDGGKYAFIITTADPLAAGIYALGFFDSESYRFTRYFYLFRLQSKSVVATH